MLVIKLGGSLLDTPELSLWLNALAMQSEQCIVIVPGGGVFADTVRRVQKTAGFDDVVAHHMALLAMDQYGLVLHGLQPTLTTVTTEQELAGQCGQPRTVIWLPARMLLADDGIQKSWEMTSDSLAAWLAKKMEADGLVLVKYPDVIDSQLSLQQLMSLDLLDAAFDQFAGRLSCPVRIIGKQAVYARSIIESLCEIDASVELVTENKSKIPHESLKN